MNDLFTDAVKAIRSRFQIEMRAGRGRAWGLTAVIAFAGSVLYFNWIDDLPPLLGSEKVPWVFLLVLFYVTEAVAVRFHFRREAHSISLGEVPLIIGLFAASPKTLIAAQLLAAGAALLIHRRQPVLKAAFHLSYFLLGTGLAVLFFRQMGSLTESNQPLQWITAYVAALIATIVGASALATEKTLSGGRFDPAKFGSMVVFSIGATLTNAGLGLVATTVLLAAPEAVWLLLIPVSTLFVAYRAFMSERLKKESIEFLYESSSILHRSPEIDSAIAAVLAEARPMFRCEVAEVVLLPSSDDDRALRVQIGPGEEESIRYVDPRSLDSLLAEFGPDFKCLLFPKPLGTGPFELRLRERGIEDAMVAVLRGETRIIGTVLIGSRVGDVTTFDPGDVRLLDSLARNLSVALEYGRLENSLSQLRRLQEELTHQAYHDSLTGLANRALFQKVVDEALERQSTTGNSISVLFVDLDDFKAINDTMGHAAGDELLAEVAQRIASCLRTSDTAARFGGDEFAILLENTQLKDAISAADRMRDALQEPFSIREKEMSVHASIGIAMGGPVQKSAEEFLQHADVAMYKAKSGGKDCYRIFEPSMQEAVNRRHELKEALRRAIDSKDMVVEYQPIVELVTGRITGAEALVRWDHPLKGLVSPNEFIPLAEETGLVLAIGRQVLRKACFEAGNWPMAKSKEVPKLSVNLSLLQLQHEQFPQEVASILEESHLAPSNLILEITESVIMHDAETAVDAMIRLKELGVLLAIDDFGTGYSSLSYLRKFPLDYIKIAKPFVDDLITGADARAFVEGIVALGRIMGLRVIGEGIEYVEQKDYLTDMNCEFGQGHFYSPSVTQKQIVSLLRGESLVGFERFSRLEDQYPENGHASTLAISESTLELRSY